MYLLVLVGVDGVVLSGVLHNTEPAGDFLYPCLFIVVDECLLGE